MADLSRGDPARRSYDLNPINLRVGTNAEGEPVTAQLQVSVPLGTWTGCPSGYPRWLLRTSATVLRIAPPSLHPCLSLPIATVQYSAVPCACCVSARAASPPVPPPTHTASLPVLCTRIRPVLPPCPCCVLVYPRQHQPPCVLCFPSLFVRCSHLVPHPAVPPPGHPLVPPYLQGVVTAALWSLCQPASCWMAACTAATARS